MDEPYVSCNLWGAYTAMLALLQLSQSYIVSKPRNVVERLEEEDE